MNTVPSPAVGDSAGKFNSFYGAGAGQANSTGDSNSLFGVLAGYANTSGFQNAFFGFQAGFRNTTGNGNSFFGYGVGNSNTTGIHNTFFGGGAGLANTTGSQNAFFGTSSGNQNTSGSRNSFFGDQAGTQNTNGNLNTLVGVAADFAATNTTGSSNTLLGSFSLILPNLTNATGIGANTYVTQSNSLILGSINGVGGGTADTNVGIGTTAPAQRLHVVGNGIFTGNLTVNGTLIANIPAGSANYIQNGTSQQASSNFNISGDGTAGGTLTGNVVNATTQFNLAGLRVFTVTGAPSYDASNTFAGFRTGISNTPDSTGNGEYNSFFGYQSGFSNTTGKENSFFGDFAGGSITTGNDNAFFGYGAGSGSTTSSHNSHFGSFAGFGNTTESDNTFVGFFATSAAGITNATAIGSQAKVTQSNSLVLGSINGVNGATASTSVGIGISAPVYRLHVVDPGAAGLRVQTNTAGGAVASFGGNGDFQIDGNNLAGGRLIVKEAGNVGIGTNAPADKLQVVGDIRVGTGGSNGCLKRFDGTAITGTCSSDLRFKRDVTPFPNLLDKLVRLRPVNYYWRSKEYPDRHFGEQQSYGLIAQEVEKVLPDLVTEDEQGYKAVNYAKLPLLTLQAVKELKAENDALKQKLNEQQRQVEALKRLVCKSNPDEEICKP